MAKKMDRTARSAVSSGMDKRLNPGQKALVLSLLNRYSQDTLLVSWLQRQLSFKWCSNANRPVQFKSSSVQGCEGGPVALSLPHFNSCRHHSGLQFNQVFFGPGL